MYIWSSYSSVPNKRPGRNKRPGWKINITSDSTLEVNSTFQRNCKLIVFEYWLAKKTLMLTKNAQNHIKKAFK